MREKFTPNDNTGVKLFFMMNFINMKKTFCYFIS